MQSICAQCMTEKLLILPSIKDEQDQTEIKNYSDGNPSERLLAILGRPPMRAFHGVRLHAAALSTDTSHFLCVSQCSQNIGPKTTFHHAPVMCNKPTLHMPTSRPMSMPREQALACHAEARVVQHLKPSHVQFHSWIIPYVFQFLLQRLLQI